MPSLPDVELYEIVNIFALLIGLLYGLIAQKTQFCFSGAIKDYVLEKSTRRASSLLLAMITAIVSSQLLSEIYTIDFTQSIYLQENVNYYTIVFGGVLFGSGMMLADGCSSRHLVKFAQGSLNSLVTVLFIAIFAYITSKGLLSYGFRLLQESELLLSLSSIIPNKPVSMFLILAVLLLALWKLIPNLKNLILCSDGFLVCLLIGASWFVTGVLGFDDFEALPLEGLSFVFASGKTLEYLMFFSGSTLSFSVSVIIGVLLGAFIMSMFNKKYRFGCASAKKNDTLKNAMIGGSLMGTGGILSLGCTVGQGLTGLSTLAFASVLAITSIALSAYVTAEYMKKKDTLPSCFAFDWKI